MLIADEVTTMVDQRPGWPAGCAVGLTKTAPDALVPHHHYNKRGRIRDRTIKLSDTPDNTDMVRVGRVAGVGRPG